ncbi:Hypothetical predicted protein, partial [Pelobates cultripes]
AACGSSAKMAIIGTYPMLNTTPAPGLAEAAPLWDRGTDTHTTRSATRGTRGPLLL